MSTIAAKIRCGACGRQYGWKAELAGRKVKCKCGEAIVVPASPPGAAPPPPPEPAPDSYDLVDEMLAAEQRAAAAAPLIAHAPPPPPVAPPLTANERSTNPTAPDIRKQAAKVLLVPIGGMAIGLIVVTVMIFTGKMSAVTGLTLAVLAVIGTGAWAFVLYRKAVGLLQHGVRWTACVDRVSNMAAVSTNMIATGSKVTISWEYNGRSFSDAFTADQAYSEGEAVDILLDPSNPKNYIRCSQVGA